MTLNVGDVFLAINPALSGDKPHFNIVVHTTADRLIVVTYTTTEIEKARHRCQKKEKIQFDNIEPETLVLVSTSDSASFATPCAIDCNIVQMMPEESFLTRPAFKILQPITNPDLILRIKEAIKRSFIVEQKVINLL